MLERRGIFGVVEPPTYHEEKLQINFKHTVVVTVNIQGSS